MDVFLLPSLYEGLGMVVIEAQCSGLPCVVSTAVPSVAKLNDNVEFMELGKTAIAWNKKIKDLLYNKRSKKISELETSDFNIKV